MDSLTVLRTFGKPGLTPTKHVRIFADRYYLVTMQNTERDIGDGYYLADGEYLELLPGDAARERRDARLNHCNGIEEWRHEVFAVLTSQYGRWDTSRKPLYAVSQRDADIFVERAREVHAKWIRDCETELARHEQCQALEPGIWRQGAIRDCKRTIEENRESFRFEVLRVR